MYTLCVSYGDEEHCQAALDGWKPQGVLRRLLHARADLDTHVNASWDETVFGKRPMSKLKKCEPACSAEAGQVCFLGDNSLRSTTSHAEAEQSDHFPEDVHGRSGLASALKSREEVFITGGGGRDSDVLRQGDKSLGVLRQTLVKVEGRRSERGRASGKSFNKQNRRTS